ncbi:MAG: helix-turn-helix transcriptional regulator [Bacteroidales bacterium]|nr:helix-turn-helix transcriptional regulator [Candidatus Sodaliphilus limicaballi]
MNQQKDQKNKEIRDALFPDCPIRNVLARVGDKWSLLVLYNLQHKEPVRFKELQRQIPDISQKSLTQTLRTLEEDGFVSRKVFPEVPPRVEYSLTSRALSFLPLVENMINWAKENMDEIIKDRTNNYETDI